MVGAPNHVDTLQTKIGAVWAGGNAGGVEGPAVFKSHSDDTWYLYVDVIPTTGYRPMVTNDLDAGWTQLTSAGFEMAPSTKHGGIISLTKAQYDTIRAADATSAVSTDLGIAAVAQGATSGCCRRRASDRGCREPGVRAWTRGAAGGLGPQRGRHLCAR